MLIQHPVLNTFQYVCKWHHKSLVVIAQNCVRISFFTRVALPNTVDCRASIPECWISLASCTIESSYKIAQIVSDEHLRSTWQEKMSANLFTGITFSLVMLNPKGSQSSQWPLWMSTRIWPRAIPPNLGMEHNPRRWSKHGSTEEAEVFEFPRIPCV